MKRIVFFFAFIFLLIFPSGAFAQTSSSYSIESFHAKIDIEKDTSLIVEETIKVNFPGEKHGIFRIIPVIYSVGGKTVRANLKLVSVVDETGTPYIYEISRYNQSEKIKIGDPAKTITGDHTYVITYVMSHVLLEFPENAELYWNVTGSEWDVGISNSTAVVNSPHALIKEVGCFAGDVESGEENCETKFTDNVAEFAATEILGLEKDFTIVVAFDKQNFVFPGTIERIGKLISDNWGYVVSLLPLLAMVYIWFKKGRDKQGLTENVYTKPDKKKTKTVPLFAHKHLPMVYYPIEGLTPSEVGTIIDERVHTSDVVAEIVELARLGFIKIKKTETKAILSKKIDYTLEDLKKDTKDLRDYQKYLLEKLFEKADADNMVKISSLKNFYTHLAEFKKKLYEHLSKTEIFDGNPEKARMKWIAMFMLIAFTGQFLTFVFSIQTYNFTPLVFSLLAIPLGIILGNSMPRRTARGYSLYRQTIGLRFYLKKGKWRHEIAEKKLFIEEILPLAIALGVVKELTKHMKELNVKPPDYFAGVTTSAFYSDIKSFSTSTASSIGVGAPSGRSSWSGGSGFSGGGSSGGGFGGGGGGSW
ncbi:DUF2207 domain-containing protein [Patescibacteria group bacterium]|nr:DUF2207 domain-containing protein [Patescibacteria group bacterium]MBU0776835.1 DUF2207 domain-containing protein [Patescibacteria group bacterium]MBU0846208.1 DUF2207 domain-containing protein [Patescibacteria group bacterium]MBU0922632.1 DUF2207 domain-containing protein [Patescibacteria group bacterium]MBU1066683.1 DUF2207 domain-containing protein [Patescibacteria group bacterium]